MLYRSDLPNPNPNPNPNLTLTHLLNRSDLLRPARMDSVSASDLAAPSFSAPSSRSFIVSPLRRSCTPRVRVCVG